MRLRRRKHMLDSIIVALDNLGPMVYHNHTNGCVNCLACRIGHPLAPHFGTCCCGHCPDPVAAADVVIKDLSNRKRG